MFFYEGKENLVRVSGEFELSEFELSRFYCNNNDNDNDDDDDDDETSSSCLLTVRLSFFVFLLLILLSLCHLIILNSFFNIQRNEDRQFNRHHFAYHTI